MTWVIVMWMRQVKKCSLSDNDILSDDNEWMMKREAFIGEYQHISV